MAMNGTDLRQWFEQTARSMAPMQLAMSALIGAVVLFGSWSFYRWTTAPAYQAIVSGAAPAEVAEVSGELDSAGIGYRLINGGTGVEVPTSQVGASRIALGAAGLPGNGIDGYELLDRQGFSASSFQQRIGYQRALEGELTRTLNELDSVRSASVHLSIPEDRLFTDSDEASASILIAANGSVGARTVESIVNVVANAVPGLTAEQVTVSDTSGQILTDAGGSGSGFLEQRLSYERRLETSAETMLATALGAQNAVVRVVAELDLDESSTETVTFDPETQIAIREQTITEQFEGNGGDSAGILGISEETLDGGQIANTDSGTGYVRNEQTAEYGVARTTTVQKKSPGRVTSLTVAVVVNDSLDPAPDLRQIESLVAAAVGLDTERGDSIAIETLPFDQSLLAEADEAVASAESAASLETMIGYAKTGGAILLLLVVSLFLRLGFKNLGALFPARDADESDADNKSDAIDLTDGADAFDSLANSSSPNVMKLIDRQPEEVATLLRSWSSESLN